MRKLPAALLLLPIIVLLLNGCTKPLGDGLPRSDSDNSTYHSTGWKDNPQHGNEFSTNPQNCKACHGEDLKGRSSGVSCAECHHSGWSGTHAEAFTENASNCKACHGEDLAGGLSCVSCIPCHHSEETPQFRHGGTVAHIVPEQCDGCHGEDLTGGLTSTSCLACHPNRDKCGICHEALQSHPVHTVENSKGPSPLLACEFCHDENPFNYTQFADGYDLNDTAVCDNCHSPAGAFDGVAMAKTNWDSGTYEADGKSLRPGKEYWCASCHDILPANSKKDGSGVDAPKVIGDNSTYGFYATGHGAHGLVECLECHNANTNHIDHEHRTYASASNNYQAGYRLAKSLVVPRPYRSTPINENLYANLDDFALCNDCHNIYEVLGEDIEEYDVSHTNFRAYTAQGKWRNSHKYHIKAAGLHFDSDWDWVSLDSAVTCIQCHNVHGPPNQAMMRHGELMSTYGTADKVPGMNFSYLTSLSPKVYDTEADLKDSVGSSITWESNQFAINGFCTASCHGSKTIGRDPYLGPKVLTKKAYPNSVPADGTTVVLITALVADHNDNVPSDGVAINLSPIDGGVETMYDDGINGGDLTADDNIFSYNLTVPDTVASGYKSLQITATDPDGVGEGYIMLHVQELGEVILDNTEAAYVGTWPSYKNSELYEGNGQYHEPGSGANTATWTPDIPEAGYYNVYAWWHSNTTARASDAPFTIKYDGGSETIDINQSRYGGVWVLLGTYPFAAETSGSVVLSDDADDYVIADAIKFELADPDVIIRDDINAAYVGTWPSFTNSELYGGEAQYHEAGSGANTATWTPLILEAGSYNVYARWAAHSNRATDAPYTIHYNGGSETIDVNQEVNGGQWNLLGTYPFVAGTSGSVVLSDDANEYVNADAIKFERQP